MKYLQLFFWGVGTFLLSPELNGVAGEEHISPDSDRGAIYQAKNNFKCPFIFGAFPDPTDCAYFYVCVANVASRKKCNFGMHFDVWRKRCLPKFVAVCGNDKTRTTPAPPASTTIGDNFKCPKFMGKFPHPNDCSKYYNCIIYVPSLKTCPEKELFDTEKGSCKPEKEVNCGTRQRPGFITTGIPTKSIVTEVSEADNTEELSTTEEINIEITSESTTEIETTTRLRPTGPPDHTCDEDDVDCIITETGDIEDWFICPKDIGSFPHPSSNRLFIFCMNWIPSVKKCGQNLVYSKELSTCTETTYFVELIL